MNAQITLSLRPEILQKAQQAAKEQGISPADYLVRFLEKVMEEPIEESITAQIERLSKNTLPISEEAYEQRKHDYRMKKHGS